MGPMQHAGLALALTVSSVFNATALLWLLNRRMGGVDLRGMLTFCLRLLPGLLAMSLLVWMLLGSVDWHVTGVFWQRSLVLFGAVAVGAAAYVASCWLCRVDEVSKGWDLVSTRLARRKRGGVDADGTSA
jgi:putative peptidoglycan lipid II flippase